MTESELLHILITDDHLMFRQCLRSILGSSQGLIVVGEASNGWEALQQARNLKPHVVLMDISMPVMDGIEATRRIKAELPEIRVICLSMFDEEPVARAVQDAGSDAFVSKTASSAELLETIRKTVRVAPVPIAISSASTLGCS